MIPNGNLLNLNRPNRVINVVNLDDSGSISICQKPELASNLLKCLTLPLLKFYTVAVLWVCLIP